MDNLSHIPSDFRKEFTIDKRGRVTASRRAIARLSGVENTSVNRLLEKLSSDEAQLKSKFLQPFAGQAFKPDAQIPDLLAAAIISYYAYEAGRYCTEQAKDVAFAFQAIGFRTWVQNELGWKSSKGQSTGTSGRISGTATRKTFAEIIKDFVDNPVNEVSDNARKWIYSNVTDGMYLKTHKLKAHQLVKIHGCKKNELRDYFSVDEVRAIETVEDIAGRLVQLQGVHPIEAIKQAVERALATHLFCSRYAEAALALKQGRELPSS